MRLSPEDIRVWFENAVSNDVLSVRVATLQADANWRVLWLPGAEVRTLNLLYWPTGERLEIVLQWDGALWRRRT